MLDISFNIITEVISYGNLPQYQRWIKLCVSWLANSEAVLAQQMFLQLFVHSDRDVIQITYLIQINFCIIKYLKYCFIAFFGYIVDMYLGKISS